jgi:WD40 repeat protein
MRPFALLCLCLALPVAASGEAVPDKPFLALDAGGHTARVWKVLFTPDGKQVVTVSDDKTVRLWDVSSGQTVRVLRPPIGPGKEGKLYAAALSPDGGLLAVSGSGWNDGRKPIYLVALPTGRLSRNLQVVPTGGRIERTLEGHKLEVFALAFSPDGKWLASGSGDKTVRIWNVGNGDCVQTLEGHKARLADVAFSPDGQHLASAASDGSVRIWSAPGWQQEAACEGHGKAVNAIGWAPDSKTLATGSDDQTVRLWDLSGKSAGLFDQFKKEISSVAFTPDGRRLLVTRAAVPYTCSLFDLATRSEPVSFTAHTNTVQSGALSPDGTLAVTTGGNDQETFLWRTADGKQLQRLAGKGRAAWSAAWRSDGRAIAWGNTESAAAQADQPNAESPLERSFDLVDLSEGPSLAGGVKNLFVEGVEWKFTRNVQTEMAGLLLGSKPGLATVAVTQDGKPAGTLKLPRKGDQVRCFTWLPAGNGTGRVAVGGSFGLTLFDGKSGSVLRTFSGQTGEVLAVSPSKDGRYLLTASDDQTLRVWVPERDEPLLSLFFAGNEWIAWTPEGYYAASPAGETLMGWHVNGGDGELAAFHPAQRFRDSLYRPDVIKRLLDAGSVEAALKQAGAGALNVGDVLPPKVEITSPKHGSQLTEAEVTVEARATGTGKHPVREMKLFLDGRSYEGTRGVKNIERVGPKASQGDELRKKWRVALPPGKHRLAVQADNGVSKALSNDVEVSSGAAAAKGSLYVLAIGIADYAGQLKLNYAAEDARELQKVFEEKSKPLFDRVVVKPVLNKEATRERILKELAWLRDQMTDADVGVITFSGHGDRDDDGRLYLAPVDIDPKKLTTTGVPGDEVKKIAETTPGRFVLLLDACHSGAFGGEKRKSLRGLKAANDNLTRELVTPDYGVIVMCSSTRSQVSIESEETRQGYFTKALLEGLSGKADYNKDGVVTSLELDFYVHERVLQLSDGAQEPVTGKPPSIKPFALSRP